MLPGGRPSGPRQPATVSSAGTDPVMQARLSFPPWGHFGRSSHPPFTGTGYLHDSPSGPASWCFWRSGGLKTRVSVAGVELELPAVTFERMYLAAEAGLVSPCSGLILSALYPTQSVRFCSLLVLPASVAAETLPLFSVVRVGTVGLRRLTRSASRAP